MAYEIRDPDKNFTVRVTGPGVDSLTVIESPCDLEIVGSLLAKIERHLNPVLRKRDIDSESDSV